MTKRARRDFTEDFRGEAVRLVATSGRTVGQVAEDLGIGKSTLTRWQRVYQDSDLLSGPHDDVDKELHRLRKEVELLCYAQDLLILGVISDSLSPDLEAMMSDLFLADWRTNGAAIPVFPEVAWQAARG